MTYYELMEKVAEGLEEGLALTGIGSEDKEIVVEEMNVAMRETGVFLVLLGGGRITAHYDF